MTLISRITDEASYEPALSAVDELLTQVGDAAHPLGGLVESLIGRVSSYQDAANHVPPAAST